MLAEARSLRELDTTNVTPETPSWAAGLIHPQIRACLQRYLAQLATFRRPSTVSTARGTLVYFFRWLQEAYPEVRSVSQLQTHRRLEAV